MRIKTVGAFSAGILLLLMESTVFHGLTMSGVIPNTVLCIVVLTSLFLGSATGRRIGLVLGLLQDLLFLRVVGFFTLIYFLTGQLAGLFKTGFDHDNLLMYLGIIALFETAYAAICYLFLHFFQGRIDVLFFVQRTYLPEVVLTLIACVPLFLLARAFNRFVDRRLEAKRHRESTGTLAVSAETEQGG